MSLYQRRSNSGGLPTTNGGSNSHNPYGTPQHHQQQHSMYPQQQYNPSPPAAPNNRMMPDHKLHNKPRRNSSSSDLLPPTISKWLSHIVILLFSVILIMYYRSSYHKLNQKFQSGIQENNNFVSKIDSLERKGKSRDDKVINLEQTLDFKNRELSNLQKAKRDLLSENEVLSSQLSSNLEEMKRTKDMVKESGADVGAGAGVVNGRVVKNERGMMEVEDEGTRIKRERKEKASAARVEGLRTYIQEESRREVLDRWGQGPHQVRIEMEFPEETELRDPSLPIRYMTIELAPISIMPHSVHMFLEQVHHKLWEGTSFVINAEHIIQASALSGDEQNPLKDYTTPFKTARLDTLAFQEYDKLYPHEMYTVGFAGRPGGRDFYLNMMDNTDSHGPGGQEQHDLEEEADPCFGKVVDGFDHLKVMEKRPTKGELYERRVRIKSTTVLTAANRVATPMGSASSIAMNVPPAASPNNPADPVAAAGTSTTNANSNPDPKNTGPSGSMNPNAAAELNPNNDPMNNAAAATNRRGPPNTLDAERAAANMADAMNRRGPPNDMNARGSNNAPNGVNNLNQNRVV